MTRREVVKSAIQHHKTDYIPYCIDLCTDAWENIKPRVNKQTIEEFLNNDVRDFYIPWWDWKLGDDWKQPDIPTSRLAVIGVGSYEDFYSSVKTARDTRDTRDKYFLVRIYGSHLEKAQGARGFQNFMTDLAGSPTFIKKLLNTIMEKNMVMLENILSLEEIDGILLGSDWGSQKGLLMSMDMWNDMIRPGEQKEYDLIHAYGKDVWIHSCGCIEELIPTIIEMGVNVLNPLQPECMNIANIKARYGDKLAFWGGISTQKTLPFGNIEEVQAEVRNVRDMLAAGGGYILSPAQSIQNDVSLENILAFLEVAREGRQHCFVDVK